MIENELKKRIEDRFSPSVLLIENQSAHHHGHAGSPDSGESHFLVTVVSDDFVSMNRMQRHKAVKETVSGLFSQGLHALSLKLYTQDEYKCI